MCPENDTRRGRKEVSRRSNYGGVVSGLTATARIDPVLGQFAPEILTRIFDGVLALDDATVELVLALRHPVLTKLLTSLTGLGSGAAAVVLLGLCYLAGWRRELAVSGVSLAIAGVVVVSLMALVQRPFPPQPVCVTDGSGLAAHSFPSGHTAAVTIYAVVARESDVLPFGVTAVLAALVAFSRIYLGTHYLSDTVAGVLIGVGAVLLARRLLDRDGGVTAAVRERVGAAL